MDEMTTVPYIVYEASEARSERTTKRLIVALIVAILVGLLTNLAWLYVWNQYEYVDESTTRTYIQDGEGLNIIGSANEVTNGPVSDVHSEEEEAN